MTRILFVAVALLALIPAAIGQPAPGTAESAVPTADQIQSRIESVEASADLDDATKAKALELYRLALSRLEDVERAAA